MQTTVTIPEQANFLAFCRYIVVPLTAPAGGSIKQREPQPAQQPSCTAAQQPAVAAAQAAEPQAMDSAATSAEAGSTSAAAPLQLDWAAVDVIACGYQVTLPLPEQIHAECGCGIADPGEHSSFSGPGLWSHNMCDSSRRSCRLRFSQLNFRVTDRACHPDVQQFNSF